MKYNLLFILVLSLFYFGCASTGSTTRYNRDKKVVKEETRYTHTEKGTEELNKTTITKDDKKNHKKEEKKKVLQKEVITEDELPLAHLDSSDIGCRITDENGEEDIDDSPVKEESVDISYLISKYNVNSENPGNKSVEEKMLVEIIKYLGTPYRYGGNSENGIDCSAFTQSVFKRSLSISLNRSARDQYTQGFTEIDDREELKFGDLVFFNTRRRVRPGHVGVYIGDNLFVHASSSNGVIVSSLNHDYYSKRFMGGRRVDGVH